MSVRLVTGDCRVVMAALDAESVDAIVCDPPYGLEFMGKEWDKLAVGRGAKYAKGGDLTHTDFKDFGTLPSYVNRPAERCANCGKQAWSGSPCQCDDPRWILDNSPLHTAQAWHESWAREALRVLKPGGHLLAFGGTRTHHRLMCAIEDAGFEIRDTMLYWGYASGFPKSLDVSKAIDKAAGVEREVVGRNPNARESGGDRANGWDRPWQDDPHADAKQITAPATDLAAQWAGWGTALKPAFEPIVVARKPLIGSVAVNVARYGTGGLNIDGCRIEHNEPIKPMAAQDRVDSIYQQSGRYQETTELKASGRWPANVILGCCGNDPHDAGCPVALLDAQSGEWPSTGTPMRPAVPVREGWTGTNAVYQGGVGTYQGRLYADTGGASRFFFCAKASRSERNAGLDGMPERDQGQQYGSVQDARPHTVGGYEYPRPRTANHHPTVKPISLCRWLCRLVCQPGGLILDPFLGSGSTGCAAVLEGFAFIGIEQDAEYIAIAARRIRHWQGPLFADVDVS